jgi:hypothetical protein
VEFVCVCMCVCCALSCAFCLSDLVIHFSFSLNPPCFKGEVKRIQLQMRSITARCEEMKRKASKLESRKRAALEEETKKVEAEKERLRARE